MWTVLVPDEGQSEALGRPLQAAAVHRKVSNLKPFCNFQLGATAQRSDRIKVCEKMNILMTSDLRELFTCCFQVFWGET